VRGVAEVQQAIAALTKTPVPLDVAKPQLPKSGGVYAWWIVNNALAGVPPNKHPSAADHDLIYIGVAPHAETSASTLKSRVVGNHMRGNIAASPLRQKLAALLLEELALTPIQNGAKVTLPRQQNLQLSEWQEQHLRLTWHPTSKPWLLEPAVITAMAPPLNLADNSTHPFHKTLSAARQKLQQAARP
jgi:GIY-YIG catalytic domain-containing protein